MSVDIDMEIFNVWNREGDESILRIYDIESGEITVVSEFAYVIEAPNWTPDGKYLIYNSKGLIYKYELATGDITEIYTDYVTNCNNDHVLSPKGDAIAVSWTNYGPEDNATIIYGSKGCMKIFSSETDDIVIQLEDGTDTRLNVGGISTNKEQLNSGIIDAFVDTVLGYRELLVEVRDGRNTLACLEAARLSAESGQWVRVNNVSLVRA